MLAAASPLPQSWRRSITAGTAPHRRRGAVPNSPGLEQTGQLPGGYQPRRGRPEHAVLQPVPEPPAPPCEGVRTKEPHVVSYQGDQLSVDGQLIRSLPLLEGREKAPENLHGPGRVQALGVDQDLDFEENRPGVQLVVEPGRVLPASRHLPYRQSLRGL